MDETTELVTLGDGDARIADGLGLHRPNPGAFPAGRRHAHGFHQVTLFLSSPGRCEWRIGDGFAYSGRPSAGDVVVIPAYVSVAASVRRQGPSASVSVRLSTDRIDRAAEASGLAADALRRGAVRRDPFLRELVGKLSEEPDGAGRELLADSLGTALAVHLLREYAGPRGDEPARDDRFRRVTAYIEDHLDEPLPVGRLAAIAGLSPYHFIRRFRAATGATPHQYVIRRRVERARALIADGRGIAEAAARAGFSGQSHLHPHVRRVLGVTPGDLTPAAGRPPRRPR